MIIVEGPRNTGKTYLINQYIKEFPNQLMTYKFPFFQFFKELEINTSAEAGNNFSYGKDLAFLSLAKANLLPKNLLLDRGFVSSIVFSKVFRKEKEAKLVNFANSIITHFEDLDIDIVYITPDEMSRLKAEVPSSRDKDESEISKLTDEMILPSTYHIWYGWALELFKDKPNIRIHRFTNNFDEQSVIDFNKILNSIKRQNL